MGTALQKPSPLELPLGPNTSFPEPGCSFPAVLAAPRAQQPQHGHLVAVAAGTDSHVHHSPFTPARLPSPRGEQGWQHALTSRAGTVVELQNKLTL